MKHAVVPKVPDIEPSRRQELHQQFIWQARFFPQALAAVNEYRTWTSRDQREAFQQNRLCSLLQHASEQVPAYRRLDFGDRRPFDVDSLGFFPITERADLRDRFLDYCDDDIDPDRCYWDKTSGTTGVPLRIIFDEYHLVHSKAMAWRRAERSGVPSHKRVLIPYFYSTMSWFEHTDPLSSLARIARLSFGADESADREAAAAHKADGFEPHVILGHPHACLKLAELLDANGLAIRPLLVETTGETLLPEARRKIEAAFEASVRDLYGMREVGTIASECGLQTYHVEEERLIVEVLGSDGKPSPPGITGQIVVTNLENRAMPIIRYATGDLGTLKAARCDCGDERMALAALEGRNTSAITLPDGTQIRVRRLVAALEHMPIRRFQFVHHEKAKILELILQTDAFNSTDIADVSRRIAVLTPGLQHSVLLATRDQDFMRSQSGRHLDLVVR